VLTDDAPVYDRPRSPGAHTNGAPLDLAVPPVSDLRAELLALCGAPNIGSRRWIWRQYDHVVRGGTTVRPGSDAGIVRVPCERDGISIDKFLAFAVDCNGRHVELDPYVGAAMAIAEVCRNLVCSGAEPIGITDCLNFGNPERPDVMETFSRAIDGLAAGCIALGVPIVSGNVSLYNETDGRAILPTPTVAAVGLIESPEHIVTQWFKRAGDVVLLLGNPSSKWRDLGGSEYLTRTTGKLAGEAPMLDLEAEAKLQKLVLGLARGKLLASAHDVADGGLAVTLAECCATGPDATQDVGARIDLDAPHTPMEIAALLFGEAPTRVIVSVSPSALQAVLEQAKSAGVPARELGVTGGDSLSIALIARHGEMLAGGSGAAVVRSSEIRAARDACLDGIVGPS
jgi:phosphoribosylformylglycinamidine (FGAM) synthase-like enzyme